MQSKLPFEKRLDNSIFSNQFRDTNNNQKKTICLILGDSIIQKSQAIQKHLIEEQFKQYIKVLYLAEGRKNKYQFKKVGTLQSKIITQAQNDSLQNQSKIIQKFVEVELYQNRESFFIGSMDKEQIKLQNNLNGITAQIIFNDIVLDDPLIEPIHLMVNYAYLVQNKNSQFQLSNLKSLFQRAQIKQCISDQTIQKISNHLYSNKRKLKISDVSKNQPSFTYIKILKGQENSVLEEGQIFRVGLQPQFKIEKIYIKIKHFFMKYQRKNHNNNAEMIFDVLQSFSKLIAFAGIDAILSELFMLVQERNITKKQYQERFDDDNLMLKNKIDQMLEKSCILIQTEGDINKIENFMLVADKKNQFNFGRMEYSDILFLSTQVSRSHGLIEYNKNSEVWNIMDGSYENGKWKSSTFGLWLQIQKGKYYYIDPQQILKIGNNMLRLDVQETQNMEVNIQTGANQLNDLKNQEVTDFLINLITS